MKFLKLLASVKTIIAFIGITFSTQAYSQETSSNKVANKTDWSIFVEDNPKECWSVSKPKETINLLAMADAATPKGFWQWMDNTLEKLG